jgi:hypothetical protein
MDNQDLKRMSCDELKAERIRCEKRHGELGEKLPHSTRPGTTVAAAEGAVAIAEEIGDLVARKQEIENLLAKC